MNPSPEIGTHATALKIQEDQHACIQDLKARIQELASENHSAEFELSVGGQLVVRHVIRPDECTGLRRERDFNVCDECVHSGDKVNN